MVIENSSMVQHFSIESGFFGNKPKKVSKVRVGDILILKQFYYHWCNAND